MEVKIDGLEKLDTNYFDQIAIEETDVMLRVNVFGGDNFLGNGGFSNKFNSLSDDDKIITIVKKYLDDFKVNGVTKGIPLVRGCGHEAIVYSCNGNKQLRMKLYHPKFKIISNMIREKFMNDRYEFFWNEDIKSLVIESSSEVTKYEKSDDSVKLVVKTDNFRNILNTERKFIKEFLNYKFWEIGEEIKIRDIFEENSHSLNRKLKGHVIECGDMLITFSSGFEFSFIYSIINSYNEELFQIKKEEKKRQLKLEGF